MRNTLQFKNYLKTTLLLAFFASSHFGFGQISISNTNSVTQNFNTLASSGSPVTFTNNSTIPNWFSQRTGSGTTYTIDNGGSNAGTLYSYGTTSNSDRALGSLGSGNAAAGSFAHGVLLRNVSGNVATNITVTYTLEQWRNAGTVAPNVVTFWYQKNSTAISNLTPSVNTSWTQVTALSTTSPINSGTAGAIDGNSAVNKVTVSNVTIPSLTLADNEYLMLKWEDPDNTGSDHGLGIDDVTISWTVDSPITWNGSTSNSWSTATNWTPNTVPDGSQIVLISSGTPVLDTDFTIATGKSLTVNGTGSLTVNPTKVLTVAGTAAFNNKDIILTSDASGTAAIGQVTGTITGATNVTVERYIQGRRAFRFLTPGVTTTTSIYQNWQNAGATTAGKGTQITGLDGATNGFDTSGTNNPSLHTYDAQATGTTTGFTAATNTNVATLKAGQGYRLLVRGDRNVVLSNAAADDMNVPTTLSAKGTLTTGTVVFDSSVSSPAPVNNNASNTQTNGYTLIGNPYASPVDWEAVTKSGVNNNAYYSWDPTLGTTAQRGRYVVYSADTHATNLYDDGSALSQSNRRYLQSGQAVFIKNAVLATPATVTFNEANKANVYSYVNRSNQQSLTSTGNASLFLSVYDPNQLALGGAAIDGAVALFGNDYTTALDAYDVDKLSTSGENLAFVRENKNLAIEAVSPVVANDVLFVKTIQFQANKNYTFKVNTNNFDTTLNAKMIDTYLNTETPINLTQPSFVTFTTTSDVASYGSERFKIVFNSAALGNQAFNSSSVSVYPNPIANNQFTIALPTSISGNVTVRMSNMLGQEVYKTSAEATSTLFVAPTQQLEEGIYVVSISNNGQVVQAKVIVKK